MIFREFGTAIIAIITGVMILFVLFGLTVSGHHGILDVAGVTVHKNELSYTDYEDFTAVNLWSHRSKPQVGYVAEKGRFFAGEGTNLLKRYFAKDFEENVYPMDIVILSQMYSGKMYGKLIDIRKIDGTSVRSSYAENSGMISFPSAGVYDVYFKVRDRENLTMIYRIPVAVDEGRNPS